MLNDSHLSKEAACPGCGVTWKFQEGEKEKVCTYCKNTVLVPEPRVNTQEVESLLAEGDKLCNALEFREAWYYYRLAKELDPFCAGAYWGLIRAAYGVQIVHEDKSDTRYVVSTRRVSQDVMQCEDWHALREKLKEQPARYSEKQSSRYSDDVKTIRGQQQLMKKLWDKGWRGEYDIYLCYKETERYEDPATGKIRSRPSKDQEWVRAFYDELSRQNEERKESFRIFYAPVTLKDAAGDLYAAHLSHALMTSRIMLLMGTQPEYFDTSWVLGERRRFYRFMEEEGEARKIIPVFNRPLIGGKAFEEIFPREHAERHWIDVADGMESAAKTVLDSCAEMLKQECGKQPGSCQHVVSEREYDVVCGENARLKQAVKDTENKLEQTTQDRDRLTREKEAVIQERDEAQSQRDSAEAENVEKDRKIAEIEKQFVKAEFALDNERKEKERLQERERELIQQKAAAEAETSEKIKEIDRLNYRAELDRENARKEADRLKDQIQQLEKEKWKLEHPEKKSQPPSDPPGYEPPAPPVPPAKASYLLREYGFRQSSGPNGPTTYGPDLASVKKESPGKLNRIDEIFVTIRSRKNSPVSATVRLEGISGRYSETAKVTLSSRMMNQVNFRLGDIPLTEFNGEFTLTVTDNSGETVRETMTLKG